jgi:hypothetical protein
MEQKKRRGEEDENSDRLPIISLETALLVLKGFLSSW